MSNNCWEIFIYLLLENFNASLKYLLLGNLSVLCVCVYPLCVCVFIHSFLNGYLGYFCVLAVLNNTAVDMRIRISLQDPDINYLRCLPRNRIDWSCDYSILNFLSKVHTNFYSGYTIFYIYQHHTRAFIYPHTLVIVSFVK